MTKRVASAGSSSRARWLVPGAGVAALLLLGSGIALLAPLLTPPSLPAGDAPGLDTEGREFRLVKKEPPDYGLPAFPGAFSYVTQELAGGHVSIAFSVRRGSADTVVQFYRKRLAEAGWQHRRTVDLTAGLQLPDGTPAPRIPGTSVRWEHPGRALRLGLSAFDHRRPDSAVQVGISLEPLGRGVSEEK